MHLSDEQIMELDEVGLQHLASCEHCSLRLNNLKKLRRELHKIPVSTLHEDGWERLLTSQQRYQGELKSKQLNRKIRFWRIGGFALAASLVLVFIWPASNIIQETTPLENLELSILIEENNLLQKKLLEMNNEAEANNILFSRFRSELRVLDLSIQRAYVHPTSIQEKANLWTKRQKLIKKWISREPITTPIRI